VTNEQTNRPVSRPHSSVACRFSDRFTEDASRKITASCKWYEGSPFLILENKRNPVSLIIHPITFYADPLHGDYSLGKNANSALRPNISLQSSSLTLTKDERLVKEIKLQRDSFQFNLFSVTVDVYF
jgi:hypothetical protein